ncbi:unnamed protein product [Sphagnum jensenii]|uniref:N-acetyltransferase domain-containing protein n=1 Tax=Sphagnum jensenii TaxID=128206 RepID=A0ABP1BD66_9BRYO
MSLHQMDLTPLPLSCAVDMGRINPSPHLLPSSLVVDHHFETAKFLAKPGCVRWCKSSESDNPLHSSFFNSQHVETLGTGRISLKSRPGRKWQLEAIQSDIGIRLSGLTVNTNWKTIDIEELRSLLAATNQNCEQFPKFDADGSVAKVDPVKLQRALRNSFVVVALNMRVDIPEDYYTERPPDSWLGRNRLVAFGRATSDHTLTASIYDLAVAPSLQRQGIGRKLLQKIVREISRQGISDIAAMATPDTRCFFQACGFGSDILGSTTMVYRAKDTRIGTCVEKNSVYFINSSRGEVVASAVNIHSSC